MAVFGWAFSPAWVFVAIAAAIAYPLFGAPVTATAADGSALPASGPLPPDAKVSFNPISMAVFGVGYVLALWTSLATQVKRWHDRGASGWWVLINFIPLVGGIWTLVSCGFLEGQKGANKYGPDPRDVTTA